MPILPISTVIVQQATSGSAVLSITRYQDGSIQFVDTKGTLVRVQSSTDDAMKRLYEAIEALAPSARVLY